MKTINLSSLLKKYSSGWVALSSDYKKVVTHGKTFKEVSEKLKDRSDIVLISASKNYRGYVTIT